MEIKEPNNIKKAAVIISALGIMSIACLFIYYRFLGPELTETQLVIEHLHTIGFLAFFGVMMAWGNTYDKQ